MVMVSRFCCLEDAQGHIQAWRNLIQFQKLRSLIYVHHHSHWRNSSAENSSPALLWLVSGPEEPPAFPTSQLTLPAGEPTTVGQSAYEKGSARVQRASHTTDPAPTSVISCPGMCAVTREQSGGDPHKPFPPGHTQILYRIKAWSPCLGANCALACSIQQGLSCRHLWGKFSIPSCQLIGKFNISVLVALIHSCMSLF